MKRTVTTPGALKWLAEALLFDDESGGRGLRARFAELDLPAGSRLVEAGDVRDIHEIENLELPVEL
eukprot:491110-Alexandrium_andersonii.AAC.1